MINRKWLHKNTVGNYNFSKNFVRDSDRDRVPNILDCKPYDPRKQGFVHDLAKRGVARVQETGRAIIKGSERREQIREKAREEYYTKKEEEEKRYAREKAHLETEKKLAIQKARIKRAEEMEKKGRFSHLRSIQPKQSLAGMFYGPGSSTSKPKMKRKVKYRKRK